MLVDYGEVLRVGEDDVVILTAGQESALERWADTYPCICTDDDGVHREECAQA